MENVYIPYKRRGVVVPDAGKEIEIFYVVGGRGRVVGDGKVHDFGAACLLRVDVHAEVRHGVGAADGENLRTRTVAGFAVAGNARRPIVASERVGDNSCHNGD